MIGEFIRKLTGQEKSKPTTEKPAAPETKRSSGKAQSSRRPSQDAKSSEAKSAGGNQGSGNRRKRNSRRSSARKKSPASTQPPWTIDQFPVAPQEGKTRFHDLQLPDELMHGIADLGFEYCSPIQAQSLPFTLDGQDLVGKAQTGTGKTAAFLVSIIDDLIKHPLSQERYAGEARALIIAPTRELVIQIADDAVNLCKYSNLKVHTLVGGMDYEKQRRRLQQSFVDILVATPGRLLDFCGNSDIHLDQTEILVIDEADRMLDMGFIPQVKRIIRMTPRKTHRQTLLFSATFTEDVLNLAEQWTDNPKRVEIEPESVATDTVEQHVYLAATEEKFTLLYNILQQPDVESLIVFANRRDECRRLAERLEQQGLNVGLLSGEIAQNKRIRTLDGFKKGDLKVLVATDVAGRGIHIDGISHVVNFTLPEEPEDYVHRIGRTGRAGKSGTSISFACEDDAFRLMPLEELLGKAIQCEQPPEALLAPVPKATRKASSQFSESSSKRRDSSGGNNRRPPRRRSSRS